ncbi:MAG TPA: DUF371 domain-containing protein [Nitrososphaerales archaeon]|nr:DUF371 domain-containing protein [Nitrososphaerales archaeon]
MEELELQRRFSAMDEVTFRGHPMVRSLHPTTIEVTTATHLTERGDCIIGVGASKGCSDLDRGVKARLQSGAPAIITIVVEKETYTVRCSGDPRLELSHPDDMVIRKSEFVSDRTLALRADSAAKDIPRSMVRKLRDPAARGTMEIRVA